MVTLLLAGWRPFEFKNPAPFVLAIVLLTHAMQRFSRDRDDNDEDLDESKPMELTADARYIFHLI